MTKAGRDDLGDTRILYTCVLNLSLCNFLQRSTVTHESRMLCAFSSSATVFAPAIIVILLYINDDLTTVKSLGKTSSCSIPIYIPWF